MKNRLKNIKALLLLAVVLVMGLVVGVAHADSTNTVLSTLITPVSPEDNTTIDQRVAARKSTYKAQLANLDTASLASKCILARS